MAEENTNKAIVENTIVLYVRLVLTTLCGLLTTRFALQALGANEFGLFSVVGAVISLIGFFNTVMLSTSNRYIASAIGAGDKCKIRQTFNVNLLVHAAIATFTLIIAIPLGDWYIYNFLNFDGDRDLAVNIYNITIIGSVISFYGIPYNGLLMAKEKFWVFCGTDIVSGFMKMAGAWLLIDHFQNKLFIYAVLLTVLTAYPTLVFIRYCYSKYPEIVSIQFVRDTKLYKEVLGFSVWVSLGALASIGRGQGSALIVNAFFNTIMNTALGLANSVNAILQTISGNLCKSISPQIVKTYSAGNLDRCMKLVAFSSKLAFLAMYIVSIPFFTEAEWILGIWLVKVPPYTVLFVQLLLIDGLIFSMNASLPELVFAIGKIKWYQIIVNSLMLLSVFVAWILLAHGYQAYMMIVVFIAFTLLVTVLRQILLNKIMHFDNLWYIRQVYIPSLLVLLFSSPVYFISVNPILHLIIALSWVLLISYFVALSKAEKLVVGSFIKKLGEKCFRFN